MIKRYFFTLLLSLLVSSNIYAIDTVDFTLPDIEGNNRTLSEFRGKWVVVNYWATWCPPCLTEIPELVEFHEAHKDKDAVVIGVDFEELDLAELKEFTESYFMSYPILQMKPAPRSQLGVIAGLPTSFLISPEGKITAKQTGPVTAKMIEEYIQSQSQKEQKSNSR